MKNIDAFIDDGGVITVGRDDISNHDCIASAADAHNLIVLLARRDGETTAALIKRLDKAIGRYFETDETVDEINPP